MSNYKIVRNPFTGKLQKVVSEDYIKALAATLKFKEGVDSVANLPSSGNVINDARITNDSHHLYVWDGSAWQDQGDIFDINWGSIDGKPSSTPTEIDDTVTKVNNGFVSNDTPVLVTPPRRYKSAYPYILESLKVYLNGIQLSDSEIIKHSNTEFSYPLDIVEGDTLEISYIKQ